MKTKLRLLAAAAAVLLTTAFNSLSAQSSTTSHTRANGNYMGWDNTGTSGTLEIVNDFNSAINFSTNGAARATITATGIVGIGTASPSGSLLVISNSTQANGAYSSTATTSPYSVAVQTGFYGICAGATYVNIGTAGEASTITSSRNYGVVGLASASSVENVAVTGDANNAGTAPDNIGVKGIAGGTTGDNTGGLFIATGTSGDKYAVRGTIFSGGTGFEAAGYFDGNVWYTGTSMQVSDARFKTNVTNLQGTTALSFIEKLNPKKYEFKTEEYPQMALPHGFQYGLIAQEVETIVPELVQKGVAPPDPNATSINPDGTANTQTGKVDFKGVNYVGLIPILVGAIKEQQATINLLNNRLQALEQNTNSYNTGTTQTVELNSNTAIVLDQNVPNPFEEQTVISYSVPADAQSAEIVFYDITGKLIKTVALDKGNSRLTVFTANLASGMYSYSLLVNGNVVETKKMLKTNNK